MPKLVKKSEIWEVPDLIKKLKELAKCGGLINGMYTIRIHKHCMEHLITDLEHTNNAAGIYWQMREQL